MITHPKIQAAPQKQPQLQQQRQKRQQAIKAGLVTKSTKAELERLEEEQERIEIEIAKEQIVRPIIPREHIEAWIMNFAKTDPKSQEQKQRMLQLRNRVYPAIGHLKLDKINGRHIQQFVNDLLENGKSERTGKPLSRKTVVHHLSFISNVFTYAVKMDMLTDNPRRRVTVPKGEAKEKKSIHLQRLKKFSMRLKLSR